MRLLFTIITLCSILLFAMSVMMVFLSTGYGYACAFAYLAIASALMTGVSGYIALTVK